MDISIIVFSGIIVCGISALPLVLKGLNKLVRQYLGYQEHKEEKLQQEKIETTKDELKETLNSGNLADLINVSNKLGNEQKKKNRKF